MFGRTPNKYMLFVVKQASSRQQSEPQAHEHEGSAFPVTEITEIASLIATLTPPVNQLQIAAVRVSAVQSQGAYHATKNGFC